MYVTNIQILVNLVTFVTIFNFIMIIHHLQESNSILNKFISEIRNVKVQKDSLRFRRNIERIGEVLGYELSKKLSYSPVSIETPLGNKEEQLINNDVVLCSILRAGLPLHHGLLNYFDDAKMLLSLLTVITQIMMQNLKLL